MKDQPVLSGEERLISLFEPIKTCQRAGRKGKNWQHLCAFQHIKMSPCLDLKKKKKGKQGMNNK